ncbi:MAG: hypothetical protein PHN74_02145 [Candidatus Pacebacteria bacterium]|nr:hypothetical protein [Candidatus Paceibacterota bacterium]
MNQTNEAGAMRKSYLKHVIIFLAIVLVAGGLYWAWKNYWSPDAKLQKNVELYQNAVNTYEEAMRNDTYGGKTPQETLDMFIEALKKGDVDLASKYFVLESTGSPDPQWLIGLQETEKAGKLNDVVGLLQGATPDLEGRTSADDFKFRTYENGQLKAYINMQLNDVSNIWKIESL